MQTLTTVLGATLIGLNLIYIVTFIKKKSALGGVQLLSLQNIMYTDFFTQSIFIFPFITMFIVSLFTSGGKGVLSQLEGGTIFIIIGMGLYLMNTLIQTFAKKGFYDNGVVTSKGVLLYDEITSYSFGMDYKAQKLRVTFNSNGKGTNAMYIVLDEEYQDAVKAFLRRHVNLKQNIEIVQNSSGSIFKSFKKRKEEAAAAAEAKKGIKPPTPRKKKKRKK